MIKGIKQEQRGELYREISKLCEDLGYKITWSSDRIILDTLDGITYKVTLEEVKECSDD